MARASDLCLGHACIQARLVDFVCLFVFVCLLVCLFVYVCLFVCLSLFVLFVCLFDC
jgi:nuclear pore complex protein Nup62